jgi:hypothetical protein
MDTNITETHNPILCTDINVILHAQNEKIQLLINVLNLQNEKINHLEKTICTITNDLDSGKTVSQKLYGKFINFQTNQEIINQVINERLNDLEKKYDYDTNIYFSNQTVNL